MGKGSVRLDRPGWSAAAEGVRAWQTHCRRRLVHGACVLVAAVLAGAGLWVRNDGLLAGAAVAAAIGWWVRPDSDPDRWARGADAEMATAQLLARLPRRFVVLHDRHQPGSRGNIDHLVIGPSGVWVIDSKSRRARLRIRRGHVWAGDYVVDPEPAARQAAAVSRVLGVPVGAIVAVHGQGLRRRGKVVAGVRIMPAARIRRRLKRHRSWSRAEVVATAAQLDRHFPRFDHVRGFFA